MKKRLIHVHVHECVTQKTVIAVQGFKMLERRLM